MQQRDANEAAVPMPGDASFACARSVHALTPAIIFCRHPAVHASMQWPVCVVGSRQSRWAGSGIPRRARVSGTHRHVAQPGNEAQLSRGRSPTAARTLLRVEEDSSSMLGSFICYCFLRGRQEQFWFIKRFQCIIRKLNNLGISL